MESVLSVTLFSVIDPPNVRIALPKWVQLPSAMQTFSVVTVIYFMVTAGLIYDVINEPPSIGSFVDERGIQRPQAIMPYRINGQYILEGLVASFMFSLTAIGMIILDKTNKAQTTRTNRIIMLSVGATCVTIGYMTTRMFIKIKMPGYLN